MVPLWDDYRVPILETFVNAQPLMVDIRDRLVCFKEIMEDIDALPAVHVVGTFQINFSTSCTGAPSEPCHAFSV